MLFSSPIFLVFSLFYFIAHWTIPHRLRLLLIIIGSTIFYGYWNPAYIWVCYLLSLMGYCGGFAMARATHRKSTLACLVALFLIPLLSFKYLNFFLANGCALISIPFKSAMEWPLPLGISFITFTILSYIIDIYRGTSEVEPKLSRFVACILFFPHLIAGPIVRPVQLIPQIARYRRTTYAALVAGLGIFTLGLVKKLVFADSIAILVDRVFAGGSQFSALEYLLAIYGFTVQIYCDFSGYTDMAIGVALALGVRLPNNFDRPYVSVSLIDFWKRWHITLSRWLRDYLYIPLGGNRGGLALQCRNVLITMALGGLWHGASWNFVFWGALHGLGIAVVHMVPMSLRIPRWVGLTLTFHFVAVLWVFFRARELSTVWRVLSGPFTASGFTMSGVGLPLCLLILFGLSHRFDSHRRIRKLLFNMPATILYPALLFFWILAITMSHGNFAEFIYFDF